jgi:hypothetical protein
VRCLRDQPSMHPRERVHLPMLGASTSRSPPIVGARVIWRHLTSAVRDSLQSIIARDLPGSEIGRLENKRRKDHQVHV